MTIVKCYASLPKNILTTSQPKDHGTVARTPTQRCGDFFPPRTLTNNNNHNGKITESAHGSKDLLAEIQELKHRNSKLKNELDAWKAEARAWPRGLGKISPVLRRWLEDQEERYGVPDVKQNMEDRRYVLRLLKERGLLSDKQRRETRGF